MPSPIASVLAAQGGRYGAGATPRSRTSRLNMFGNSTAVLPAAPTSTGAGSFGTATGYTGVPTAAPYAPLIDPTPTPMPRPTGTLPSPVAPPPTTAPPTRPSVGTGVGPVDPPPPSPIGNGSPGSGNRYTGPPDRAPVGTGVAPIPDPLGRGALGPNGRTVSVNPLPGAPYGTAPSSTTPPPPPGSGLGNPGGGGGGVPPGGGSAGSDGTFNPPGGHAAGNNLGPTDPQPPVETDLQRAIREARGTSPGDPSETGTTTNNQPRLNAVGVAGLPLPGEQEYYDTQIARRARGLYDTAEAKTNYGLERLEDRGMGQSSVAGQVAAENYGQYARDADAAAADVQAKQFTSREQRLADARKFEFDKSLQAAQYALAQQDSGSNNDQSQLQAALAMFGQAFGQGGYNSLYSNQYQNQR